MAEWIVAGEPRARPLGDGHPPLRRRTTARRRYTLKRTQGGLRDLLRHPLPRPRAPGRPAAAASRAPTRWHAEHGAAFGEKSGWERVNWYESNAAAGDESLRPRGWAGMHWSPAIGAEHRATRERGRAVRRVLVRQARGRRARAPPRCSSGCATTASRATSAQITYTQMLNRRGGIECDFTVTRVARGAVPDRHRHRVRQPRPDLDPPPRCRDDGSVRADRRDLALGVLRAVGPARPRRPRAADARPARLRLHAHARARPSATCRCARCA